MPTLPGLVSSREDCYYCTVDPCNSAYCVGVVCHSSTWACDKTPTSWPVSVTVPYWLCDGVRMCGKRFMAYLALTFSVCGAGNAASLCSIKSGQASLRVFCLLPSPRRADCCKRMRYINHGPILQSVFSALTPSNRASLSCTFNRSLRFQQDHHSQFLRFKSNRQNNMRP